MNSQFVRKVSPFVSSSSRVIFVANIVNSVESVTREDFFTGPAANIKSALFSLYTFTLPEINSDEECIVYTALHIECRFNKTLDYLLFFTCLF